MGVKTAREFDGPPVWIVDLNSPDAEIRDVSYAEGLREHDEMRFRVSHGAIHIRDSVARREFGL